MADKITIGLDDQTAAGAASAEENIEAIRSEAKSLEQQLDRVSAQADAAAKDVAKMGDRGKDVQKLTLRLTEINQGLELLKKGFALVSGTINTLADEGNPAFVGLRRSIEDVQRALLDIAQDPEIQSLITSLSDQITSDFIPAIKEAGQASGPVLQSISDGFRGAQRWISNTTLSVGEFIGVFDEAATEELRLTKELDDARRAENRAIAEKNRLIRENKEANEQLGAITSKVSEEEQLRNMAAIEDHIQVYDLLEQERKAFLEMARTGESSGKTREQSLRRIELLERRLVEIPRKRAEEERKAAEESRKQMDAAAQAELDAETELQRQRVELVRKAEQERINLQMQAAEQRLQLLKAEREEARKLIEGADGGKLLERARGAIDPRAVRERVAQQRGQAAADEFTRANAGDLDASDANAVRQFRAQRDAARQQAERQAAQQFNRGMIPQQEISRAQTELIQTGAQQAVAAGNLSETMGRALVEAANNQQRMTERINQQEQALAQVVQTLKGVGQTNSNSSQRSRAIAGGIRR